MSNPVTMEFTYADTFGAESAEAYERLLLDALLGDGTLFIRRDEIEVAWDRVTKVLEGWAQQEDAGRRPCPTGYLPRRQLGATRGR